MADALIVVDVQNDFVPGGALAVPRGDEVVPRVRELIDSSRFGLVVATRDWHPPDHGSFREQGGPWPQHCVAGTPGAELVAALAGARIDAVVDAGRAPDHEGYSAFEHTELAGLLRERDVERVTVLGLATDYCVRATALDALREGFAVTLDTEGSRGIEAQPGDVERALDDVRSAGGEVT